MYELRDYDRIEVALGLYPQSEARYYAYDRSDRTDIEQVALAECIDAFLSQPNAEYAVHLHHDQEAEAIQYEGTIAQRIAYIATRKDPTEHVIRFALMRPIAESDWTAWNDAKDAANTAYDAALKAATGSGEDAYWNDRTAAYDARNAAMRAAHSIICKAEGCPFRYGYSIFDAPAVPEAIEDADD